MARLFYYPFKKHTDEPSTEKNRTAVEEFLNNLAIPEGGLGGSDHLFGVGPPDAGLGEDNNIYFDAEGGAIYYKDPVNGWTLVLDAATQTDLDNLESALTALIEGRVRWRNLWTQTTYERNDMVRDGIYTMIANTQTVDRPAPQPFGSPAWIHPDNPLFDLLTHSGSIFSGMRIQVPAGELYEISAIRAWVQDISPNAKYRIVVYDAVTGVYTFGEEFAGDVVGLPGWVTVNVDPTFVTENDDLYVLIQNRNDAGTTNYNHPWVYTGPSQVEADPGLGNTNRDNQHSIIRLSNTDDDAVDRTAELVAVTPGTVIRVASEANLADYFQYSVVDVVDNGTYHTFSVTLLDTGGVGPPVGQRTQVYFEVPIAQAATYVQELNTLVPFPTLEGYISFDAITGGTPTQNGYGVDVQFQQYTLSEDWDIVAVSGGSGGGGSGEGGGDVTYREPMHTGVFEGGLISFLGTTVTVAAGSGVVINSHTDPLAPSFTLVQWAEQTIDPGLVTDRGRTSLYIDANGVLSFDITGDSSPEKRRASILVGYVFHDYAATGEIIGQNRVAFMSGETGQSLMDFVSATQIFPILTPGTGILSPNPNLTFSITGQTWWAPGISSEIDEDAPNRRSFPPVDPATFYYIDQLGAAATTGNPNPTTLVEPDQYESAPGVISPVPGSANRATIQRVFLTLAGNVAVMYGQQYYDTLNEAVLSLNLDIAQHEIPEQLNLSTLIAFIVAESGATDLSDGTDVVIIDPDGVPIGGGATPVHDHDGSYLPLTGGAMRGDINLEDDLAPGIFHDIYNLNNPPLLVTSAISKQYLDDQNFLTQANADLRYLQLDGSNNPAYPNNWLTQGAGEGLFAPIAHLHDGVYSPVGHGHDYSGTFVLKAGDTMTGPLLAASGSAAAPAYSFSSAANMGIYRRGTSGFGFVHGGEERAYVGSLVAFIPQGTSGLNVWGAAFHGPRTSEESPSLGFGASNWGGQYARVYGEREESNNNRVGLRFDVLNAVDTTRLTLAFYRTGYGQLHQEALTGDRTTSLRNVMIAPSTLTGTTPAPVGGNGHLLIKYTP